MTRGDLTTRQRDVLEAIRTYIAQHRYAPTMRELCSILGFQSTNAVTTHYRQLRRKGYINWEPGSARAVSLTAKAGAPARPMYSLAQAAVIFDAIGRVHRLSGHRVALLVPSDPASVLADLQTHLETCPGPPGAIVTACRISYPDGGGLFITRHPRLLEHGRFNEVINLVPAYSDIDPERWLSPGGAVIACYTRSASELH